MKVVWVLGSGFSCGLDGPMLNQLFDEHRYQRLASLYGDPNATLPADEAKRRDSWLVVVRHLDLVRSLLRNVEKRKVTPPWRDAEEYVELLGLCAEQNERAIALVKRTWEMATLGTAHPRSFDLHAQYARTYLAAVTHEFIASSSTSTERWQPYRRWVSQLDREQDHVVTFNYDLVVEKASEAEHPGQITRSCRTQVGLTQGWFHKLHGSVDWKFAVDSEGQPCVEVVEDPFAAMMTGADMAVAVPGPMKRGTTKSVFDHQWSAATKALSKADTIVFVGYRFPPSDSDAKLRLLEAIKENTSPTLMIRLVLGPTRSDDVNRLAGLLKWALSHRNELFTKTASPAPNSYRIEHEPMYGEDFMAVFRRDKLGQ